MRGCGCGHGRSCAREGERIVCRVRCVRQQTPEFRTTTDCRGWVVVTEQRVLFEGHQWPIHDAYEVPLQQVTSVDRRRKLLEWSVQLTVAGEPQTFYVLSGPDAEQLAQAIDSAAARSGEHGPRRRCSAF
ncbi:PH domain-containing protein [Gryllotalpicola reticulitermitis]|uniref:PH domain-containing protein n=1 Tax=Gryllotalpicola reticulitermitis TaxID=1184153 RepID=A0ABV8Q9R7_9MICO